MEIGGELERNLRELAARVSEQEARGLFLRHLDRDRRYSFSVETPTELEYRQLGQTPDGARRMWS